MKKWRLFIIPLLICSFFFYGCKKNMVEERYNPIINPVIPDFSTKIAASVHGFITAENGEAIAGAAITAGSMSTTTDQFGYFEISNTLFAKSIGFIQVQQAGYFTGYRSFLPVAGKETFIRLQLIPETSTGTIEAAAGGTVTLSGGATVTLPADAVVTASSNIPYSGVVNISAHWFDPSDMAATSLTMPGDLTGVDSAGHLNVLQTFGMLAVELTGSSGDLLQMAPGKKASLHLPLPASLQSIAPANIPLWYFDESKGVWQQEGHAIKSGNSYDGLVSHFSYWNCDIGFPLVSFTAQLVDTALNPLLHVPITISSNNISNLTRTSYTDVNGVVSGLIPAHSQLTINAPIPCNQNINTRTLSTTDQPVDLGTVVVDQLHNNIILRGTVSNCSGNPVTNGYVIVFGLTNNAIIDINNGAFSGAGIVCPGTNISIIAIDRETTQRSTIIPITINQGINDIGALEACSVTSTEVINISNAVGTISYTLPQYLFNGNFYFLNDSTAINAIDLLNNNLQVFEMSFRGPGSTGSFPLANSRLVKIDNSIWQFDMDAMVNISAYGLVGQFITGSLSGNARMIAQPITRTHNIEFSIKRDQ